MYLLTSSLGTGDLQKINSQLQVFSIVQKVCAILAVFFLLLTAFLFWKWKIWEMVLVRTGLAKKKSISQMQELNASTGRLVKSNAAKIAEQEFSGQLTGDRKKGKKARGTGEMKQTTGSMAKSGKLKASPPVEETVSETSVLAEAPPMYGGKYVITTKQIVIHTDEVLEGEQ